MKKIKEIFSKKNMKKPWSYVTGAVLLAVFQIITFVTTGNPWGVSGPLMYWGAWLYRLFGGSVNDWHRFDNATSQAILDAGFLNHPGTIRNIAVIFGALLATLLASQFKVKKIKSKKQVVAAVLGGFMMGYGARLAAGCNIGALFSGIASLSLSGWVFALFIFLGAAVGSKLLVKYFM